MLYIQFHKGNEEVQDSKANNVIIGKERCCVVCFSSSINNVCRSSGEGRKGEGIAYSEGTTRSIRAKCAWRSAVSSESVAGIKRNERERGREKGGSG